MLRLGEWCMTDCSGCNERFKQRQYFDSVDLIRVIYGVSQVFSPDIRFFLFWQDPFFHPHIWEIIGAIRSVNQNELCIHISDLNLYDDFIFRNIENIISQYENIGFYISTSFKNVNSWDRKNIVRICTLARKYVTKISVQVYYNSSKDLRISNLAIFRYLLWSAALSITPNIVIDHEKKMVSDHEHTCKFHHVIRIQETEITFHPPRLDDFEFEVTHRWDIIPHTPRCYMARLYISNIFESGDVIRDHFIAFNEYIHTINMQYATFDENCYSCIFWKQSFDYKQLWKSL